MQKIDFLVIRTSKIGSIMYREKSIVIAVWQ